MPTKWFVLYLIPGRIGIWKCWFLRRGKNRSTRRKTSRSKWENQQQTLHTYGVDARICGTQARLVGGERSHHCDIPCSPFWRKIAKFANFSTEKVCELKVFTLERFFVNTTGHVRKMRQFKSKQINFWILKFFCHSFQMIYITSCAIVLHVFSINSAQMCRHCGLLDHIPTTNHR